MASQAVIRRRPYLIPIKYTGTGTRGRGRSTLFTGAEKPLQYIAIEWHHGQLGKPVVPYSELEEDRWEMRKVELFADGHARQIGDSHLFLLAGGLAKR